MFLCVLVSLKETVVVPRSQLSSQSTVVLCPLHDWAMGKECEWTTSLDTLNNTNTIVCLHSAMCTVVLIILFSTPVVSYCAVPVLIPAQWFIFLFLNKDIFQLVENNLLGADDKINGLASYKSAVLLKCASCPKFNTIILSNTVLK